jgi:hypothetical protein
MTPQLEQCIYYEICPIRHHKLSLYICEGFGMIQHHSSDPAFGDIPVKCNDYKPGEIALWRTDQMLPEYLERRMEG